MENSTYDVDSWPPEKQAREFGRFLELMPKSPHIFKRLSEEMVTSVNEHPVMGFIDGEVQIWLPVREPNVRYASIPNITGGNSIWPGDTPDATAERVKKRFGLEGLPLQMDLDPIGGRRNYRQPDKDGTGAGHEQALIYPLLLQKGFVGEFPRPECWTTRAGIAALTVGEHPLLVHHQMMIPMIFNWAELFYKAVQVS